MESMSLLSLSTGISDDREFNCDVRAWLEQPTDMQFCAAVFSDRDRTGGAPKA